MFSSTFRRSLLAVRSSPAPTRPMIAAQRPFHAAARFQARKDAQHKDEINTESNEYSKSGSDDASAAVEEAAFDPNKTSPEEQHDHAAGEAESKGGDKMNNPLNVSPANKEVSKPRGHQEGGPEGSASETAGSDQGSRSRTSGGGSPSKSGGGKSGGGSVS